MTIFGKFKREKRVESKVERIDEDERRIVALERSMEFLETQLSLFKIERERSKGCSVS